MAYVSSYTHETVFTIPAESADFAWFGLASWKGYLASLAGLSTVRMGARFLENGDIRLKVETVWEYEEQLAVWRESDMTPRALFGGLNPAPYDVQEELYENLD